MSMKLDEAKPNQNFNMSILEFWRFKVTQVLESLYGNSLNYDKVEEYLKKLTDSCNKPVAYFRNIYKEETWEHSLDDIPMMMYSKDLICGSNGSFTVSQNTKINEGTDLLIKWMKERSELKKKAIACDEAGDKPGLRKYDNLQNTKKENTNSFYGVSAMNGYILFSPDTASMITMQARELIAEMTWTLEKLLGSNMTFCSMNEFYSFVNESLRDDINIDMVNEFSIKIPTFDMLKERLKELLSHIPDNEKEGIDNNKSLFLLLKNIEKDPIKCINFYYKYNMYKLFIHNPKIMEYINWIMRQGKQFISPDIYVMKKSESVIYIEPIQKLVSILMNFVILPCPTYDRTEKYLTRGRKIVIISDTDSVITRLDDWINFCNQHGEVKFDTFYDSDEIYRSANTMAFICTEICNFMGRNMAKNCQVPLDYRARINLKNEFFFKSLIIYPSVKKNYSAWTVLREGARVNKVANTGLILTGSNLNPFVKENMQDIIFEEIHSVKDVSMTRIMKRIYKLETEIRDRVLNQQDLSFAKYSSYKSSNNAKPYSDSRIRAVMLWNHMYPEYKIEFYNKIYILNTLLEKEEHLHLIKDIKTREFVRDKIFKNPVDVLALPFGLRTIAIPDSFVKYPLWMKDIVNINNLVEFHTKSLTSLLPSVGIYVNRISSTRNHFSSLISLH